MRPTAAAAAATDERSPPVQAGPSPPATTSQDDSSSSHVLAWEARVPPATTSQDDSSSSHVLAWEARVPADADGHLVHDVLVALRPQDLPTKSAAKRALRRRAILVDGHEAERGQALRAGQLVQCVERCRGAVHAPLQAAIAAAAARLPSGMLHLEVLFEDEHMACVVKPQGMPCDPPMGRALGSAAAAAPGARPAPPSVLTLLAHTLAPSAALGALRRPRHVHRLDEPTGGLLLAAKSRAGQVGLGAAFEQRRVNKRYRALAWGRLEGRGLVRYTLDGRHCETEYCAVRHTPVDVAALGLAGDGTLLDAAEQAAAAAAAAEGGAGSAEDSTAPGVTVWLTTLDLWPHTGRNHQLRRHLALLGHPLVGEPKYGWGYAGQRLASGQAMRPCDHARLPPGAAAAGEAAALEAAATRAADGAAAEDAAEEAASEAAHGPAAAAGSVAGTPLLRAAAAAAQRQHSLKLHLWAVELRLEAHPTTGKPALFQLPEPSLFPDTRAALAGQRAG